MLLSYLSDLVSVLGAWGVGHAGAVFSKHCQHPEADDADPFCGRFHSDDLDVVGEEQALPTRSRSQTETDAQIFDPRDHDWTSPSDEDRPWEYAPTIPLGIPFVRGGPGVTGVINDAVEDQIGHGEQTYKVESADKDQNRFEPMSSHSCSICFTNPAQVDICFPCNAHFFCVECIAHYIRERISAGCVPRCPAEGCQAEADPRLCRCILGQKEFEQYLMVYLRSMHRLQNCPSCNTSLLLEAPTPRDGSLSSATCTSARCSTCMHRFCVDCGLLWHPMCSCEEAIGRSRRRRQREASRTFENVSGALGFKRCPRCGVACEKSTPSACDHMTCSICSFEFCWSCMADRRVIYAHGNHYHFPSCPHYREYHGAVEYKPNTCARCKSRDRACTPPGLRSTQRSLGIVV
eukprot:TRINITY_DN38289_c0_g1_i1.p1 TRINITY_DN38289_c0_g1~~TRINITY_DN38289_c0_g1_i1.p1  ORF type:complete len:405 (-),score=31.37 TRINITY_DN38289_c0_g1_i1:184-1398(-)